MTKFSDLALDPRVLQAIADTGYEAPTPIQAQAIPHALEGRDVLGIAQTGTGKTASFTLPMITRLGRGRARARMPRSLVLAPTRELAAQVAENFDIYAKHTKLTKALLIGGVAFGEQDKLIDRGVDVLIATPGRLLDHFERGKLLLTGVEIMVVDEADRMLDMGFIPDIERIFQLTPFTRQTLFFSATMAPEIERITNAFLTNPAKVEVARQNSTSATIEQQLIEFTPTRKDRSFTEKRAVLRSLIKREGESCTNAIIFCNRKMDVDVVTKSLKAHGFDAGAIHGDLEQSVRMKTLDAFRDGQLQLLVASDVAARGLDVPSVSHVFNFDIPTHPEDYVHRIGRTGRAGRAGKAFTIVTPSDEKYLTNVEALVKQAIPRGPLPDDAFEELSKRNERSRGDRRDEGGKREDGKRDDKRRRDRDRKPKRDENMPPASMEPLDVAPIIVEEAPTAVAAPTTGAREERPRREDRREGRRDERRDDRREERREPREDHRRDDRRKDPVVIGMGDHVPEFILRSFKIAEPSAEDQADEIQSND